jgi:hypothetical protein
MKIHTLAPLALLACLLWPGQAKATDHPFGHCAGSRAASCTLTVAANQTIFIKESTGGATPATPTDTLTLTYTQVRCDTDVNTDHYCSYYAHTGSSSGSDTVSFNIATTGNGFVVEAWDPGDVVNTGSPVDQSCFAAGTMPTGTNNVSVCSIQSTQTNDIFEYQFKGSDFFNTSFGLPANGPTVQEIQRAGYLQRILCQRHSRDIANCRDSQRSAINDSAKHVYDEYYVQHCTLWSATGDAQIWSGSRVCTSPLANN